jgi:hypothetical protein
MSGGYFGEEVRLLTRNEEKAKNGLQVTGYGLQGI